MKVSIANRQRKTRLPLRRIERESRKALASLGLNSAELSIVFASSRAVRELNRKYRGIPSTTDVLSFPLHDFKGNPQLYVRAERDAAGMAEGILLLGDVVIDPLRASQQAREAGHTLGDEIMRLIVHGLLHLLGHDHEGQPGQGRKMRRAEKALASSIGIDSVK